MHKTYKTWIYVYMFIFIDMGHACLIIKINILINFHYMIVRFDLCTSCVRKNISMRDERHLYISQS